MMPLVFGSPEARALLARATGKRFDLADVDPLSGRHNPKDEGRRMKNKDEG